MTVATLVSRLRPHVTHFSAEIPIRTKIKDEVTIGGKLIDYSSISDEFFDEQYYRLAIEDPIGTVNVVVSETLWDHVKGWLLSEDPPLVLIKGFVNVVSRDIHGATERQYSIVGYEIQPIPE